MERRKDKTAVVLSIIVLLLAVITSAGALINNDIYQDNEFTKQAWQGNDIVTLFIAVPLLIISLWYTKRGSLRGRLFWMGSLWYMIYNYVFYLFGSTFNSFFLFYIVIIASSTYALVFSAYNTDAKTIKQSFNEKTPIKIISGYMFFFAIFLGGMWVMLSLQSIISGTVPIHAIQTNHPTAVVYATDLSLLIPSLIVSATLLWKKNGWGYVFSAVVMVKSVAYSLVLIVMHIVALINGGEGDPFIALWIFLSVTCAIVLGLIIKNINVLNHNK